MMQCEGGKVGLVESTWVANMDEADGLFLFGTKAGLKFDPLRKITARRVDVPPSQRRGVLGDDSYVPVTEKVLPFERPTLPGQGGSDAGVRPQVVELHQDILLHRRDQPRIVPRQVLIILSDDPARCFGVIEPIPDRWHVRHLLRMKECPDRSAP